MLTKLVAGLALSSGLIAAMPTNGTSFFSIGSLPGSNQLSADESAELQNIVVADLEKQKTNYQNNGHPERAAVAHNFIQVLSARSDMFTSVSDVWYDYYLNERTIRAEAAANGDDRFFTCTNCHNAINLDDIWGYGCWCIFGSDVPTMKPGGKVNDEVDAMCKQLHLCYRCAMLDNRQEGNGLCNAYDIEYTYALSLGVGGIQMDCESGNPDDSCQARACSCDADFIVKMITFDWAANYQASLKHYDDAENVVFDFATQCTTKQEPEVTARSCCGDYPDRRPFNASPGSTMACCNNKNIYNSAYLTCCDDGSVVALGNACVV